MNITRLNRRVAASFEEIREPLQEAFLEMRREMVQGKKLDIWLGTEYLRDALQSAGFHLRVYWSQETVLRDWRSYPFVHAFCHEPEAGKASAISLYVSGNPKYPDFPHSFRTFGHFVYRTTKTILHELVHRAQFSLSPTMHTLTFQPHPDVITDQWLLEMQKYAGDLWEIEAYARDIVEEWYYLYPSLVLDQQQLEYDFLHGRQLATPFYYNIIFNGDLHHPAVQRLVKKTLQWNATMVPMVRHFIPPAPAFLRKNRRRPNSLWLTE